MGSMPEDLAGLVEQRYGIHGPATRVAAGVSGSALWRVDSPKPTLVRVSEHYDLQHITRVCDGVTRLGRGLPEVVAPLVADDGGCVSVWNDRPVSVWPFVPGITLDRHDPDQLVQAAQVLARLHLVTAAPGPTDPNDDIAGADNASAAAALLPDPTLDEWIGRWCGRSARTRSPGWRHGDFCWQNILCHDGAIIALVDWDDISIGATDAELAWATWEFSKSPRGDRLCLHSAEAFLTAYQLAGGRPTPLDDLVPLMRERLRRDIAFFRRIATSHGYAVDAEDETAKLAAFWSLAEVGSTG